MKLTVYQEQQKTELSFCVSNANWEKYLRYLHKKIPTLIEQLMVRSVTVKGDHSVGEAIVVAMEQDPTSPLLDPPMPEAELQAAITRLYKVLEKLAKDNGTSVFLMPLKPKDIDLLEDLYPDKPQFNNVHMEVLSTLTASYNMHRSVRLEYGIEPSRRESRRPRKSAQLINMADALEKKSSAA